MFFPGGGIGRYTHHLLSELSKFHSLQVEVACQPDYLWRDSGEYDTWAGLKTISHSIPFMRRSLFLRGQFINPIYFIRRVIATKKDIVHFSNINHLTYPFWKRKLLKAGIPIAVTVHDVKRQKAIINRTWEGRNLKEFYRSSDALFVHSYYQKNELIEFADVDTDRIYVVPHGVYPHADTVLSKNDARLKLGLPTDREIALFFGQIRDEKNLAQMIEALTETSSKPYLIIAGSGEGRHHRGAEYYRELARSKGIDDSVYFITRYISDEEVAELFTAADWAALPYDNSFTSQSGVLNVAMHYDRPVLVSSAPVLAETVTECDVGVVCDGDTAEAIANGIDKISEQNYSGYPYEFEDYKRRFSWKKNAKLTLEVYQNLMK